MYGSEPQEKWPPKLFLKWLWNCSKSAKILLPTCRIPITIQIGSNQQYSVPELKQILCDTSLVDCLYWTKAQKNSQSIELPVTTYELRVTTYIKVGVTFDTLSVHTYAHEHPRVSDSKLTILAESTRWRCGCQACGSLVRVPNPLQKMSGGIPV